MRFLILIFLFPAMAHAQSTYLPLNEDLYHRIDRYEIKAGKVSTEIFTTIKPYKRSDILTYHSSLKEEGQIVSEADIFNEEYLHIDSWEWSKGKSSDSNNPFLKHFYKKKADFYSVHTDDFDLHINPVIYVGAGKDSRRGQMLYINTRGFEVRGMVDNKVGFYTYVTENQSLLPQYVNDQMRLTGMVPHEGFWKAYKEGQAVDFLQARGYISFDETKHINIQFGHDRFFFGNGYRSLMFSDFSPPSFFFKGAVKVWKLNYLFVLNQMTADNNIPSNQGGYPNKFVALHHLSINIREKLNIGLFEAVTFSPDDSTSSDHFRLEYLNPIIFYRAIEQQNGSSDNAMLGVDFKWNAIPKVSFYGQFMLDELVLSNLTSGNGWWANKFGIQFGAKYIDVLGVANLDLQGEVNVIRPYTFSHDTPYGSYSNYKQAIAHPLGANLKEAVGILRYQPLPRLNFTGKFIFTITGRDSNDDNWGGNILKDYRTREQEFNNTIAQGVRNEIMFASFTATWQLKHNLFVDGNMIIRNSKSASVFYDNNTSITFLALRWNIPQRLYEF